MRTLPLLFSLVTFAAACGGASTPAPAPATPAPAAHGGDGSCPVEVPGTSVTVEDTATGAALVFVTTGDVAELRRRVAAMAAMHNEHHAAMGPLPTGDEPAGGHGDHAGHDMGGMDHGGHGDHAGHTGHAGHDTSGMDHGAMMSVHARADAEDVDGGARLVLTAAPDDVAALQTQLREHARHLAAGTCAMEHH